MAKSQEALAVIRRIERHVVELTAVEEANRDAWAERLTRMVGIEYQRGELQIAEFRLAVDGFSAAEGRLALLQELAEFLAREAVG